MKSLLCYLIAALLEIGGCFSFWAWLRMHKSPLWTIPGVFALTAFAVALTRIDSASAGRAYAAYSGIYILSSPGRCGHHPVRAAGCLNFSSL